MKIPFDLEIAKRYSEGKTLAEGSEYWENKFKEMVKKINEEINHE